MSEITVFKAKKIITVDPNIPIATHTAARCGVILAVGEKNTADLRGPSVRDRLLAQATQLPGLIAGHARMLAKAVWAYADADYHKRIDPESRFWAGRKDINRAWTPAVRRWMKGCV